MSSHIHLHIPARLSLLALCEFANGQGCRVERVRDGTYRLVPVMAPPPPAKAPVVDLLAHRATRHGAPA